MFVQLEKRNNTIAKFILSLSKKDIYVDILGCFFTFNSVVFCIETELLVHFLVLSQRRGASTALQPACWLATAHHCVFSNDDMAARTKRGNDHDVCHDGHCFAGAPRSWRH